MYLSNLSFLLNKPLLLPHLGLNRARLKSLYKLIVEPTILYGCSIWAAKDLLKSSKKSFVAPKGNMQWSPRAFRTSHTVSCITLAGLIPLDYRVIEFTTIRFLEFENKKNFSIPATIVTTKFISATRLNIPYDRAKYVHLTELPPWYRNHPEAILAASSDSTISTILSTTRIFTDGSVAPYAKTEQVFCHYSFSTQPTALTAGSLPHHTSIFQGVGNAILSALTGLSQHSPIKSTK